MRLGKALFLLSDFKLNPLKITLWETAARKLDFAASEPKKGRDHTEIMSNQAYISVEIVTDNPTSGKISIPQLVSVAEYWIVPYLVATPVFMSTCLCINSAC